MGDSKVRVVHYINQFFGGIGGEEQADAELQIREGAVGPGLGLQNALGGRGEIATTLICGDNYFNNNTAATLKAILKEVRGFSPDVLIAGPAFNAGRYGFACGEVGKAVADQLGLPVISAMFPENPAVETYRKVRGFWILPTGERAGDMPKVLPKLAEFALKIGCGRSVGLAKDEGYIPSGHRKLEFAAAPGAQRAVNMLMAKLKGEPFQTEITIEPFEQVPPAPPLKDIKETRIALITTSGLVPRGNPDGFKMFDAVDWHKYQLPDGSTLEGEDWEVIHGGFNTAYAQANPNLVLPLDAMRGVAGARYGELNNYFYSMTGVGTSLAVAKRVGEEIAESMLEAEVGAALLVAT